MHLKGTLCHRATWTESARKLRAATSVALACGLGWPAHALAAEQATQAPEAPVDAQETSDCRATTARSALAVGASILPGIAVHGAGHWVICERETALRLLYLEAAALGAGAVSLAALVTTGASRYVVGPLALGALGGVGLFTTTWLADIYGVAAPKGGTGAPRSRLPRLTVQAGLRATYDPLFDARWLVSQGFTIDTGLIWLSPRLDATLDGRHRRYALLAERRLFGAHEELHRHARWSVNGRLGLTDFAERNEAFGITLAELALSGRLDLGQLGNTLQGAFGTAELGYAREWHRFDGLPGHTWDALLGRIGFGVYLGDGPELRGASSLAYDHRRDTLAGGLHLPGIAAGYAGFVEHRTELYFNRFWGAAAELSYGSAFVASTYLLFRMPRGGL